MRTKDELTVPSLSFRSASPDLKMKPDGSTPNSDGAFKLWNSAPNTRGTQNMQKEKNQVPRFTANVWANDVPSGPCDKDLGHRLELLTSLQRVVVEIHSPTSSFSNPGPGHTDASQDWVPWTSTSSWMEQSILCSGTFLQRSGKGRGHGWKTGGPAWRLLVSFFFNSSSFYVDRLRLHLPRLNHLCKSTPTPRVRHCFESPC